MTRVTRALLLAAAFAPAVALKISHAILASDPGVDGGYYTDVAKHVRDGHGLATNLSLYHQGFETFPHVSPIYPIWPLVYGWTARIVPLEVAGVWLPALFWVVAVVFAALWARRLSPGDLWTRLPGIDLGHAIAMFLALNGVFFRYTSLPYTEGLAFAILFAGLWWFHPRWKAMDIGTGFQLGAWLGVLVLVRSQLIVVAMAVACTLVVAIVLLEGRRRRIEAALACASAFVATLSSQLLRLADWSEVTAWTALLRFDLARERAALTPMDVLVDGDRSVTRHLLDFVTGLPIAFAVQGPMTYWRVFHGLQYALPLALVVFVASDARVRGRRLRPGSLPIVFALALAAGGFLSLHFIRKDFLTEWHFGRRHALTAFFAFFLAWTYLARHRATGVRALAAALLLLSAGLSHAQALKHVRAEARNGARSYDPLVRELERERDVSKPFVVALHGEHAQRVAWRTDGVGFHWFYEKTTSEDVEALARLGVRWILLDPTRTADWPMRSALEGEASLWRRAADVDGFERYVRDPSGAAAVTMEDP